MRGAASKTAYRAASLFDARHMEPARTCIRAFGAAACCRVCRNGKLCPYRFQKPFLPGIQDKRAIAGAPHPAMVSYRKMMAPWLQGYFRHTRKIAYFVSLPTAIYMLRRVIILIY